MLGLDHVLVGEPVVLGDLLLHDDDGGVLGVELGVGVDVDGDGGDGVHVAFVLKFSYF